MKVVQISEIDKPGSRFNGQDLQIHLNTIGIEACQFVFAKNGTDPNTIPLATGPEDYEIRKRCKEFEQKHGVHSLVYPFGKRIMEHLRYVDADIVHCHVIHNYFLSLYDFKKMAQQKMMVWSLHDPWAFTGHCVHPKDCKGWLNGCQTCTHLDWYFPIDEDTAHAQWKKKQQIFSQIDIDLVVASKFMMNYVHMSPIMSHINRAHLIPFGIDTKVFGETIGKAEARNKHSIPQDDIVIFFRADSSEFKGLNYTQEMLKLLQGEKRITILTVGETNLPFGRTPDQYSVVEKGWIIEDKVMAELYSASDIFLMPSIAEAFGLMAVEAMMSGLPVIVFDGTALPDVTFAPDCGVVVESKNIEHYASAVCHLVENEQERIFRGQMGRRLALDNYNVETYFERMDSLYKEIMSRPRIDG